jgi:hypothetical protein
LDINEVIGKRVGIAVGRAKVDRERFMKKMEWRDQTYYEARSGRRVFRVGELVAMARASGVPAWTFLDATGISKTVSMGDGSKPISSEELLALVQPRGARASLITAVKVIRTVIDNLVGAGVKPGEGGIAHQLFLAARLIEHDIQKGASK